MKKWIIAVINVFVVLAAAFAFIMASKANVVGKVIEENENLVFQKLFLRVQKTKIFTGCFLFRTSRITLSLNLLETNLSFSP